MCMKEKRKRVKESVRSPVCFVCVRIRVLVTDTYTERERERNTDRDTRREKRWVDRQIQGVTVRGILLKLSFFREVLLKWKAQYSWPPYINLFRSAPFYIKYYLPFTQNKPPLLGCQSY